MKKTAAILLIVMVLFTGIRFNIATHYCSGSYIGSVVSFSGKLADCGMHSVNTPLPGVEIVKKHCCENVVTPVVLGKNYFPVNVTTVPQYFPVTTEVHEIFTTLLPEKTAGISYDSSDKSPPGRFSPQSVDQQSICIYLI